jgi:hypothetical protein
MYSGGNGPFTEPCVHAVQTRQRPGGGAADGDYCNVDIPEAKSLFITERTGCRGKTTRYSPNPIICRLYLERT